MTQPNQLRFQVRESVSRDSTGRDSATEWIVLDTATGDIAASLFVLAHAIDVAGRLNKLYLRHVQNFIPLGKCPCGQELHASKEPPSVMHGLPYCAKFDELKPDEFLTYVRRSRGLPDPDRRVLRGWRWLKRSLGIGPAERRR